ncbi:MAG TPA: cytochrome c biogenesis protein ResB, partial [Elusimicrobiales bacterium]|nr:cytochrome c biogenesis protein ResB [Elusimicrobiales bacterium]
PAAELEISSGTRREKALLFSGMASPHGRGRPDLLLRVEGAAPAGYESEVELEAEGEKKRATVSVNSPASFYGYKLYQHGYDPADPASTTLLVKRDPGVPAVYAGFALISAGLILWIL